MTEPTHPPLKLCLCDPTAENLAAWKAQFLKRPEVELQQCPLLEGKADMVLVPGNAFGYLESGIGLEVLERHGWGIEEELRQRVRAQPASELLVGQALLLRSTALPRPMIYAPVFRTPRRLEGTINVYLAARAAFLLLAREAPGASIAVPAMGTEAGGLHPLVSARQIRYAYEVAAGLRGLADKNLTQQMRRERKLMAIPGEGEAEEEAR